MVLEFWAAGREGEVIATLVPAFEAAHPGVRVRVQQLPWRGAHEKLLTAIVGESTPDIAQVGNTWIPELAAIGALDPLDDEVTASASFAKEDYFPGPWATNVFAGQLFGVPWYVDTRVFFYRRDLLEDVGYAQPPQTWDGWVGALRAIQARAAAIGASRVPFYVVLYDPAALLAFALQGTDPLLRDGDRYGNFQSPSFRRALELYVQLFQSGLAPLSGEQQFGNPWDEFGRGSFVFYMGAPFELGEFRRRLPAALQDSWMTAPLPGPDGPGSSLAFGASLVVFERSEKKAAAWQLIEYFAQAEVQKRFYELTGDLPPRRSAWAGAPLAEDEHARAFREQLERTEPTPQVPEWERIATEIAIVSEHAAHGTLAIDAALQELDARADRILEKRRWILDRKARASAPKQAVR